MATPAQLQKLQELLNGPSRTPPPGVKPNFTDPANLRSWYLATLVICVTSSTLAIVLRMITKSCILRNLKWEDYTMLLGYLMWLGYCVPTGLLVYSGGGIHQWNVQLKNFILVLYYTNVVSIMYGLTMFVIKLSILLQYLRLFTPPKQRNLMFWGVHIVIWCNFVFYFVITFFEIFGCNPREKYWNVLITTGSCFNTLAENIAAGAINAVSDFIILLLPQPIIWKLQMPLRKRLQVSVIFLTGFFACVTSVIRLYYAVRLSQTEDVTYYDVKMGLWTYAEFATCIICGCLPVLPKFFQTARDRLSTLSKKGPLTSSFFSSFKFGRFSTKHSSTNNRSDINDSASYDRRNQLKDYITLEERDVPKPSMGTSGIDETYQETSSPPDLKPSSAIHPEILRGNNHIWRTVHIESTQTDRNNLAVDLEQGRQRF